MVQRLETNYSSLEWSPDGRLVTKRRCTGHDARARFRNELRVNRLLRARRPPVASPRLVDHDVQLRSLTFDAVPAPPVGPKYPTTLTTGQIEAVAALAAPVRRFDATGPRLRKFDAARRIRLAASRGLLDGPAADRLEERARRRPARLRFGHGDLTARNVLDHPDGPVLIDWEWAGLYPPGYDLAFLWFSLVDVPGGRQHVETIVDTGEEPFLLSALLIQLWHLQWYVPEPFRPRHRQTRDQLVERLLG